MLKKIIILLAAVGVLSGCSLLSPVPNVQATYQINSVPHHVANIRGRNAGTILVLTPKAGTIYNTTDIVYSTYPHQIAYFAKSTWAATPAEMLKPLIINTLQKTHHFCTVTSELSAGHTYTLYTQILQLRQVFWDGCKHSEVRFTLRAELARGTPNGNQILASKNFTIVEAVPQNTPYGGVVAANRATVKMLKKLAYFCEKKS